MSKLTEIIQKHIDPHRFVLKGSYEAFEDAMKEYAEWYALQYQNGILDECWTTDYGDTLISDNEILKIKLPGHD